jgi:hypothetical protein
MTLKPIPGAPIGAPIPDFPTAAPGPLVVPESRFTRGPIAPAPVPLPSSEPAPAWRPGPVAIRGNGGSTLTFRAIPEIPAISRPSMTITISGQPTGEAMPQLDLTADTARAFLLALRDGDRPIVVTDSGNAVQVEFTIAEDGPAFTVSKIGQEGASRWFNAGRSFDVKAMAAHLLAELGP